MKYCIVWILPLEVPSPSQRLLCCRERGSAYVSVDTRLLGVKGCLWLGEAFTPTMWHTSCIFPGASFASSKQAWVSPAAKINRRSGSGAGT